MGQRFAQELAEDVVATGEAAEDGDARLGLGRGE
jgi:hypothetical protein